MTAVLVIKRAAQFRNNVNSFLKKVKKFPGFMEGTKKRDNKKRA